LSADTATAAGVWQQGRSLVVCFSLKAQTLAGLGHRPTGTGTLTVPVLVIVTSSAVGSTGFEFYRLSTGGLGTMLQQLCGRGITFC
jgi:hypothetical protein